MCAASARKLQSIGVAIVNYNAGDYLLDTVASVRREGITDVVMVDNGSSDDSIEKLLEVEPDIPLIRLPNPGMGAGYNAGCNALDTDIVVILNPDTVVHEGTFAGLRSVLNAQSDVAIVGPRLLNTDGSLYPSARVFPQLSNAIGHGVFGMVWKNNPWSRKYKRLGEDYATQQRVDWVSGAAMFTRKDAFDAVGGFDDDFFMYFEDTDLCWRLRQAGWEIVYEPAFEITHVGGVSTSKKPYRMLKEHHKSAIRYNLRTARGAERLLLPIVIAGLLLRLPVAWLQTWATKLKR